MISTPSAKELNAAIRDTLIADITKPPMRATYREHHIVFYIVQAFIDDEAIIKADGIPPADSSLHMGDIKIRTSVTADLWKGVIKNQSEVDQSQT